MREVIVCLKAAPRETDPEILGFRKELEETPGIRILLFDAVETMKSQLTEVCESWTRAIMVETVGAVSN